MRTFKLEPDRRVERRDLLTATCRGPFLVDATDEKAARQLVGLNFSIAARFLRDESTGICLWSDPQRSLCLEVYPPADDAWRQQHLVAGVDMARWFVEEVELRRPLDGLIARLRWWPCEPDDLCPA